jgi:acyl-coenzyme A synthetase/AMP-(fatty) acid ligase
MQHEPGWIATPHLRPDHRGPVERPYTPFVDPAAAAPIVEMLRALARARPASIAVELDGATTTHAELWRAVCRLARRIATADPSARPVAILLPASVGYVATVYACLAAGRICVLLDDTYPDARNALIATRTGAGLVVCTPERAAAPAWPGAAWLGLDEHANANANAHANPLDPDAGVEEALDGPALRLDDPAFILCTSGSSGEPKPIVHSQRTMLHWARTTHDALHVRADDRVLSLSSLSSLGGFTGLLNFGLAGVCLQMLDLKAGGLSALLDTLTTRPVTILRAAPSLLRSLARLPEASRAFAGLRAVQTYGEPLLKADLAQWRPLLPAACRVRCTYGSTEASGLSWFAGDDDEHDPLRVASGILMPDTLAAVVDESGRDCPRGEPGELWIRSRYNALGEWADGRTVAGRLVPHRSGDGTRVYRTGDIARCHADGVFVVLGRADRMAKVNGQRLEPAEIEGVLRSHAAVAEAEVVMQAALPVAFVVARPGAPADLVARLRSLLRTTLPAFMMPSRIVSIDAMPRLPGGKVDALALARSAAAGPLAGAPAAAPP